MVKKRFCTAVSVLLAFLLSSLSFSTPVFAGAVVGDYIVLNTPEYGVHKEPLVTFSHWKHLNIKDQDGYGISCGECHHDEEGDPLDLQIGDEVERCVECHRNTGDKPKEEKLSKRQEIRKYHKKALHAKCKDCHSNFNKKNSLAANDPGAAPIRCKGCHPPEVK